MSITALLVIGIASIGYRSPKQLGEIMPPSTWLLQNTNEGRGYDPSFVVCMRIPGKALGHGQHPTAFHIIHKAADAHMLWNERRSCEDGYVQRHHCCRPCLMNNIGIP